MVVGKLQQAKEAGYIFRLVWGVWGQISEKKTPGNELPHGKPWGLNEG